MRLALIAAFVATLSGCAAFTEHQVGVHEGNLHPCGQWPRCVSSVDRGDRWVAPIQLTSTVAEAWPTVRKTIAAGDRTRIVEDENYYLRAEILSPWKFYVDDLELRGDSAARSLSVRSTGRIGYYDFNVNRDRIEALRRELVEVGLARSREESSAQGEAP